MGSFLLKDKIKSQDRVTNVIFMRLFSHVRDANDHEASPVTHYMVVNSCIFEMRCKYIELYFVFKSAVASINATV